MKPSPTDLSLIFYYVKHFPTSFVFPFSDSVFLLYYEILNYTL